MTSIRDVMHNLSRSVAITNSKSKDKSNVMNGKTEKFVLYFLDEHNNASSMTRHLKYFKNIMICYNCTSKNIKAKINNNV